MNLKEILEYEFFKNGATAVTIQEIIPNVIILIMLFWSYQFISHRLLAKYFERQEIIPSEQKKILNLSRGVVFLLAVLNVLLGLKLDLTLYNVGDFQLKIYSILSALFILLFANLISWVLTQLIFSFYYKKQKIDVGSQYAINQLFKYFIYTIAVLYALHALGINITALWAGAAALLIGLGFGVQQTFNDLVSGIILLFERTVEVGDWVQVDNMMGKVKKIGLRTSVVETRDNISVVVPNSKLIVDNVINWSRYDNKARFKINVGVAYGSDTAIVKELLLRVARENQFIIKKPTPFVRFVDFGNSSLDFELHFWSKDFARIEDFKSDMRFEIDRVFRENSIEIPFPQRDVWFKNHPSSTANPKMSEDV